MRMEKDKKEKKRRQSDLGGTFDYTEMNKPTFAISFGREAETNSAVISSSLYFLLLKTFPSF